ncbi:hypothetical protein PIB30_082499 [Stylosanthes scabra]|uniref:Uncharacterized protein n=1 Tax=Stylosanthes scabra TaxID=79078 RepID=A0ABU6STF0_9FABA|nr:hypothetical protein [Stylosanthes scabra]
MVPCRIHLRVQTKSNNGQTEAAKCGSTKGVFGKSSTHMRGSAWLASSFSSQVELTFKPTPRRAIGSLGVALTLQPAPEPTHRRRTSSICVESIEAPSKATQSPRMRCRIPSICMEINEVQPKHSRPMHRRGSPRLCVEATSSAQDLTSPTHMRGILRICVGSRLF